MRREDKIRKEWADAIRKTLMTGRQPEVTKTIEAIHLESGTTESQSRLSRPGPWTADGKATPFIEAIRRAGLEVAVEPGDDGRVERVTFRLNETWRGVRERFARSNAP
ncbi:MAG TPA: hypothetical protein VL475_03970 [Planctomycetaceae bacterium]|nr:hypothetical protein [Planctomycetaceae bacterium]